MKNYNLKASKMVEEEISVRQATKDDLLSLTKLMNDLGYATTYEEMKNRFENIHNHPDYKTFIATIDNKVLGMAGATQNYFYEQNGKYVRIVALVTDPSSRQKGIGKKLIQVVEDWAKEVGAFTVLLNCGNREEREQAHAFYKNRRYTIKSSGYVKKL